MKEQLSLFPRDLATISVEPEGKSHHAAPWERTASHPSLDSHFFAASPFIHFKILIIPLHRSRVHSRDILSFIAKTDWWEIHPFSPKITSPSSYHYRQIQPISSAVSVQQLLLNTSACQRNRNCRFPGAYYGRDFSGDPLGSFWGVSARKAGFNPQLAAYGQRAAAKKSVPGEQSVSKPPKPQHFQKTTKQT